VLSRDGVIRQQVELSADHPLTITARSQGGNRVRHRLYTLPQLNSDYVEMSPQELLRMTA